MSLPVRMLFLCGSAAIVIAVAVGVLTRGMEYASWVAGTIGALSIAASLVVRTITSAQGDESSATDSIDQTRVKARGHVIGKSGDGTSSDRIRQNRVEAGGDVIGKQAGFKPDNNN